jgi:hypothetical protein
MPLPPLLPRRSVRRHDRARAAPDQRPAAGALAGALLPARIWLCDHEPGTPENKVDQPYLQGQIGLDLVPPIEVWHRRGLIEITAAEFEHQIEWLKWAERNAPNDPRFTYRKPVTLAAIPIPRFGATP